MHKKFLQLGKEIVKQFAISFFFCSLLFIVIYLTCHKDIKTYVSLINMMTIVETDIEREEIKFDSVKKRLANYPYWGELWATIKIPEVGIEAPVYQGDSLDIIKYGIGHYSGSYFPGEGASIILAGHNSKEYFQYLPKLKNGSKIIIEANYGTYTYQVTSSKIINYQDTSSFPIQKDKEILMMYTCYPVTALGFTSQRYVIYAELVGDELESKN